MKVNKLFLTIAMTLIASVSFAQTIKVSGQVTDATTGEPVGFVNLMVVGTTTGTAADVDGLYTINADKNASLIFSMIGYEDITVPVNGRAKINVEMTPSETFLEEAVVSALGITRAAKSLTYSAQTVSSEELTNNRTPNVINSLAGKASGVTITQSASGMGGSAKVSIRGYRSVSGSNDPLYIIDGVPMSNSANVSGGVFGSGGSYSVDRGDGIGNLNADDIESISILKGASASALYGTEAANGVILITTKKGKAGKLNVNFNSSTTFDNVAYGHELQKDYGYVDNFRSWGSKISNGTVLADTFFKTAPSTVNTISIQGGSEKNQTYLSIGNTYQGTVLENDGKLNRFNITVRNSTHFRDNLSLETSAQFITQHVLNRPATGGLYNNPLLGVYHFPAAGVDINYYKQNFEVYDMERNLMAQTWWKPFDSNNDQNPYWIMNRMPYETWRKRALGSATLRWDINPKIYVQLRASVDFTSDRNQHKVYATTPSDLIGSENGMYKFGQSANLIAYGDFLAGYKDKWGDFGFNATVGTSIRYNESTGISHDSRANKGGLYYANIFTLHNMTLRAGSESWHENELIGLFGTVTLSFRDWLFLDVTGRNDWSSTLSNSTSFKSGFFYPSVGLSAALNDAFNMPQWVDLLKVRGSYAVVGNDLPSRITNPTGSVRGDGNIESNTTAPFGELKPELSGSFEIGTDIHLFKNRLFLDFTYYKTNTKNQLFELDAPAGSGYSSYYVNSGNIQNKGFEATLGFVPVETKAVKWTSNFNFSRNKNTVIELNPEIKSFTVGSSTSEGYEMKLVEGGSFGDVYGRAFKRNDDGSLFLDDKGLPVQDGSIFHFLGNSSPAFNIGWNNTLALGNFDINFLIDGRFGGIYMDLTQADIDGWGTSKASADARNKGYVEYEGHKFNDVQAFYERVGTKEGINEYYTYDATNIRLREASLTFNLPQKWLGKDGFVKNASISAIGRNLFFFYKKTAGDADALLNTDAGWQGFSFYNMPATRSIGFNVKVTF